MTGINLSLIVLPSETEVPPGPHRQLLIALHDLYRLAGFPSTRDISKVIARSEFARDSMSHQTVANILAGRRVPRWLKVEALVDGLLTLARHETTLSEIDRFRQLWESTHFSGREHPASIPESQSQRVPLTEVHQEADSSGPAEHRAEQPSSSASESKRPPEDGRVIMDAPAHERNALHTILEVASWNGPEMFDVSFTPGACIVKLNVRHPMGNEIWEVVNKADAHASTTLSLLLISWARMEDEVPSGRARERIKSARIDWSRYARLFVEQLRE